MEYEWEEDNVSGDVPEFGAIFMSSITTKRECFKRKIFALPSSWGNFVKQVKEGMVLFLFEFEKRQLFGVYRATSDGSINIVPHAFNSSGKQFPAQYCRPLFENEFRDAIRENYFSGKKFHFGLSEEQVHHLLQLFSTRKLNDKLPPRQMTRVVTTTAGIDRTQVDHGSSVRRERSENNHYEYDINSVGMDEVLEYAPDRAIEAYQDMHFIDDRLENRKNIKTFGHNFLINQAGDFLHKRKRIVENKPETDLFDTQVSLLAYGNDNHEASLDKERIPAACSRSLTAENTDNDCHICSSLSPAIAAKYAGSTFDLTGRSDYEMPLFEGTNRHGIYDDRFLMNDTIEKNIDLHASIRPLVSNVNEEDLKRHERAAADRKFFMNTRSGHKHHMNDDFNRVIASENLNHPLHMVERPSGASKLLMGERIASEYNLDNRLQLDVSSEKHWNLFDSDQKTFLHMDKVMKTNYKDGDHGSTTSYMSCEYDRNIPRQVADDGLDSKKRVDNSHAIETISQSVSTKYTAFSHLKLNSLDCFSKPSSDTRFSQLEGPHHFKTLNSTFHDSIVTRTVPSTPELPIFHHGHTLHGVDQGATLALDHPHYASGGNSLALLKNKSFERVGFGRHDRASDFGDEDCCPTNYDLSHCHAAQVPQSMELMCKAPADDGSLVSSPSTFVSVPFTESLDWYSLKKSPLAPYSFAMLSQGMQKCNYWRENDERIAGNEVLYSNPDMVDLDIYHHEKHMTNDAVNCYKSYNRKVSNEDSLHYLNSQGGYSNFEKQRRSVFTRLSSTPRLFTHEEKEKDTGYYLDKSVDEVMDMLNSSQNFRMKNLRKCKPVVRQHEREEIARIEKRSSPEQALPRFTARQAQDEASQAFEEGGDVIPKETRAVEFKRRSELKKDSDNCTKNNVLSILDSTSRDIQETTSKENVEYEGQVNKLQKRRKLVRPVFDTNVSVDGVRDNQILLSQSESESQSLTNKTQ